MFRKDSARAAASSDKVVLPLKLLWSWKGQPVKGASVISTGVVRNGDVFFVSGPKANSEGPSKDDGQAKRILFCADSKTGQIKWQQALEGARMHPYLAEDIGPVVTPSGTVYVLDYASSTAEAEKSCAEGYIFRAFSADKGKLLGTVGVPTRESLSRFFLRDGHGESNFLLTSKQKPDC